MRAGIEASQDRLPDLHFAGGPRGLRPPSWPLMARMRTVDDQAPTHERACDRQRNAELHGDCPDHDPGPQANRVVASQNCASSRAATSRR